MNKSILITALALVSLFGVQSAHAAITMQLDLGDSGGEVTELQGYLAQTASIYPSGLVTGYFGQLTKAGVERFQTVHGIISQGTPATTGYGRVGPQTMAKINSLMAGGPGLPSPMFWDTVPVLGSPSVNVNETSATITWTTNETTQGQVYYDTTFIRADEATGPRQQPFVSGTAVNDSGGTSHSITLQNLQPNTVYYYITRGVDSGGNMSMTWPNNSFRTE